MVSVYSSLSLGVTALLKTGKRSHVAAQSAAVPAHSSMELKLTLAASRRRRVTGRDRVKTVDPWKPVAGRRLDLCVTIPAPPRVPARIATTNPTLAAITIVVSGPLAASEFTDHRMNAAINTQISRRSLVSSQPLYKSIQLVLTCSRKISLSVTGKRSTAVPGKDLACSTMASTLWLARIETTRPS